MFELLTRPSTATRIAALPAAGYRGPERRQATSETWRCMAGAFDEVDYGMLLLAVDGRALYVNATARAALGGDHPLRLAGDTVHARDGHDGAQLYGALEAAAKRGLRKLLTLGVGPRQVCVSIVPLGAGGDDGRRPVLLMLEKRGVCGELTLQGFARDHRLTPGETRVLLALCAGARPAEAAQEHGVALSTVRTQIKSIRTKTGASSIAALVRWLASLPPLMGVLREGGMVPVAHEEMPRMVA